MSFLTMMEAKLPPGFRFHPRDDELVCDYLAKKISGGADLSLFFGCPPMMDVDLNKCEPWDLPELSCVGGKEWYFFSLRDRKYATGQRTNRATISGYWKATGKDRHVTRKGVLVGMRKTLVFYKGRAPKGTKTDWVMHEFRMELVPTDQDKYAPKEDWVLCRIFFKNTSSNVGGSGGMSSKQNSIESSYEDTCSSSIPPPATETTYITFSQQQPPLFTMLQQHQDGYEQVPCFSNAATTVQFRSTCDQDDYGMNRLDDKKVMRAVLERLTRMEGKKEAATSLGEGNIDDNYLCDNGLSSSGW